MYLSNIKIKNFRGYQNLLLDFSDGINVFIGQNGSGKTNLLEAINYLSFMKSFKNVEDADLIKIKEDSFFISGCIKRSDKKDFINLLVSKNEKKILLNNKPVKKLSDLNEVSNVIIFSPDDVNIFKDSPLKRRSFLDINISKLDKNYIGYLKKVNVLLKERNELLKTLDVNNDVLDVLTKQLIKYQKYIIDARIDFTKRINEVISKVTSKIKGNKDNVNITYSPFIKMNENYENEAYKMYLDFLDIDKKRKFTSVGIHHEDFILNLNGKNIVDVGSQGENRIISISLKLSPYFLVKDKENHPIICLDDVMSELDNIHQEKLIKFLKNFEQVFITATDFNFKGANIYHINNHKVTRR